MIYGGVSFEVYHILTPSYMQASGRTSAVLRQEVVDAVGL